MTDRCPECASTDIAQLMYPDDKGKDTACLDCGFHWKNGGRR